VTRLNQILGSGIIRNGRAAWKEENHRKTTLVAVKRTCLEINRLYLEANKTCLEVNRMCLEVKSLV